MGIGNFFGMLPEKMQESRLYGVELDGITGRIAKQLYPKADIKISGFEKTDYPNDFFDVAVGNVPFGQYKVADRQYDKNNFLIHDYFFAKTLDKVRPGGVVAFVTSKGTMDKKSPEVRKYLAQRAELLGAVRLPNTAFKNAGTEVTSDILFLKKRDRVMDLEPDWVHLSEDENGIASRVYDTITEDGKEKRVLNKKETTLAAQKQETIREAFKDWIFRDPDRRQDLVAKYNELFNSTRPREYDGTHLKFPGMTPDIELKPHQKNAVAHVLYGNNTLLAHCVGAGKTFEMTAAAMESKRLG